MGEVLVFPMAARGSKESQNDRVDGFHSVLAGLLQDLKEERDLQAEVKLRRLFDCDPDTAAKYLHRYKSQDKGKQQALRDIEELGLAVKKGPANDFILLVSECFGIEVIDAINYYIKFSQ